LTVRDIIDIIYDDSHIHLDMKRDNQD